MADWNGVFSVMRRHGVNFYQSDVLDITFGAVESSVSGIVSGERCTTESRATCWDRVSTCSESSLSLTICNISSNRLFRWFREVL